MGSMLVWTKVTFTTSNVTLHPLSACRYIISNEHIVLLLFHVPQHKDNLLLLPSKEDS